MDMVTVLTATLIVSTMGCVGLLLLKRFELATNRVVFARLRPKQGGVVNRTGVFIERVLPLIIRYFFVSFGRFVRRQFRRLLAWVTLHVEKTLERVLHTVRERSRPRRDRGEASSFLRAVADHKRTVLHQPGIERAIAED